MGTTFKCDQCQSSIIINRPSQIKLIVARGYVFCSRKCTSIARKRGGKIRTRTESTNLARYGTLVPINSLELKEKIEIKCLLERINDKQFQRDEAIFLRSRGYVK